MNTKPEWKKFLARWFWRLLLVLAAVAIYLAITLPVARAIKNHKAKLRAGGDSETTVSVHAQRASAFLPQHGH